MSNKSKRVTTIILGILIGAFLSGVLCAVVRYQVELQFPSEYFFGSGLAWIAGIVGLVFGAIGGAIIGGIITGFRLRMPMSVLIGLMINGIVPLLIFYGTGGSNAPHNVERSWNYSAIGQAICSGFVGILVSIFSSYRLGRQVDKLL